ncbi:hypothetical protein N7519_011028 [Penicillium mononematosum]|uniref:uncharacterized protein n=1 Tax=Penicillium mononematosum TaxID=268346 RepID=UPI0025472159|nr:uncharacterized protein N7519_011028 [Penicillium mononematosum]KAJ6180567.1 hypothetical protein N7519_011028 [Penicillium mononematosum]
MSLFYLYFTLSPISITCRIVSFKALFTLFVPKVSHKAFLVTLLNDVKVDHKVAVAILGINQPASRMRYIRLQQKYGFNAVGHREKKT